MASLTTSTSSRSWTFNALVPQAKAPMASVHSTFSSSQDSLSETSSSSTIPDSQGSQNDDSENAPFSTAYKQHIQDQLSKRLSRLPEEYFNRHAQLQITSSFWNNLLPRHTSTTPVSSPLSLKSRQWAEYVVDASRIYLQAGLSVKRTVSIINRTIRYVAICILNTDNKDAIIFEDGRNVFYEPESRGMPKAIMVKYIAFLEHLRNTTILRDSGSDSQSEDGFMVSVASTVSSTPSVVPGERAFQSIERQKESESQDQGVKERQPKNRGSSRRIMRFPKRKEEKKQEKKNDNKERSSKRENKTGRWLKKKKHRIAKSASSKKASLGLRVPRICSQKEGAMSSMK